MKRMAWAGSINSTVDTTYQCVRARVRACAYKHANIQIDHKSQIFKRARASEQERAKETVGNYCTHTHTHTHTHLGVAATRYGKDARARQVFVRSGVHKMLQVGLAAVDVGLHAQLHARRRRLVDWQARGWAGGSGGCARGWCGWAERKREPACAVCC